MRDHLKRQPPNGNFSVWDVDPYDTSLLAAPRQYYRELRERGPLVWLSRYGIWASGQYKSVKEIFGDWKRFCSSRGVGLTDFKTEEPWRPPSIILEVDPPDHDRTRSVMAKAMSAQAISALRERFQAEADALVEQFVGKGPFDAVAHLSQAYPLKVFPDAVGLDEQGRENLLQYATMVFNALGPDNALRRNAMADAPRVVAWIADKCRREALSDTGFGATIYAAADNGEITQEEAALLVRSLLSAGIDTTVSALGNAILCLARHPRQWEKLKETPARVRQAFEEVLRYTTPVHSFCRTANVDTEVAGIPIREGDKVLCVLGAANLDPDHWNQPDEFDIERPTAGHLALGVGIHSCVGQQVARLEGRSLLGALARKVDRIELHGEPEWSPGNSLTTLASLPVSLIG